MHPRSPSLISTDTLSGSALKLSADPHGINRRRFAQTLAGVIAVPLAAGSLVAEPLATPDQASEKPEDLSITEWSEVQARYKNLLRVYGQRLNAGQRHTLLNVLIGNERMLTSIRQFVVQNSDPPALTLRLVVQGTGSLVRDARVDVDS